METKHCSKCGEVKAANEFAKCRAQCKACHKEYMKEYQKSDKCKEYYKEYYKEWKKERCQTDPFFVFQNRTRSLIYTSFKAKGYTKRSRTHELLGADYETVMAHLGPKPRGKVHVDHICPCAQARNEEELIKLQHYTNLRWMKASENLSKSDNWTEDGAEMCRKLLGREWEDTEK
jgi:hypothetical protein